MSRGPDSRGTTETIPWSRKAMLITGAAVVVVVAHAPGSEAVTSGDAVPRVVGLTRSTSATTRVGRRGELPARLKFDLAADVATAGGLATPLVPTTDPDTVASPPSPESSGRTAPPSAGPVQRSAKTLTSTAPRVPGHHKGQDHRLRGGVSVDGARHSKISRDAELSARLARPVPGHEAPGRPGCDPAPGPSTRPPQQPAIGSFNTPGSGVAWMITKITVSDDAMKDSTETAQGHEHQATNQEAPGPDQAMIRRSTSACP